MRGSDRRHGATRVWRWGVGAGLAVLAVSLALFSGVLSPGGSGATGKDFPIVAYQGEALLGGQQSSFSKVFTHGKPVVLNFWAGQCPPCRAEMPAFQKVADEYEGRVIFVGVDVGVFTGLGNHADAQRLLRELEIRYPSAYAVDSSPLRMYSVRAMPTTIFFSAEGTVVEQIEAMLSERQLRSKVERLVAASS
ncbi:MAG: TlpA family protein disulfide reductase [Chloroflexi bacterium]|nr:TlpA family protein disulfide reductase [Chloroflexota bacterium]